MWSPKGWAEMDAQSAETARLKWLLSLGLQPSMGAGGFGSSFGTQAFDPILTKDRDMEAALSAKLKSYAGETPLAIDRQRGEMEAMWPYLEKLLELQKQLEAERVKLRGRAV